MKSQTSKSFWLFLMILCFVNMVSISEMNTEIQKASLYKTGGRLAKSLCLAE